MVFFVVSALGSKGHPADSVGIVHDRHEFEVFVALLLPAGRATHVLGWWLQVSAWGTRSVS